MSKSFILGLCCISASIMGMENYEDKLDRFINSLEFLRSNQLNDPQYKKSEQAENNFKEIELYINEILVPSVYMRSFSEKLVQKQVRFALAYLNSGVNKDLFRHDMLICFIKKNTFDRKKAEFPLRDNMWAD